MIKSLGPDELDESDLAKLSEGKPRHVVYHYTVTGYEGSGFAAVVYSKNRIAGYSLGHCSCYGPVSDLDGFKGTARAFFAYVADETKSYDPEAAVSFGEAEYEVGKKVKKLLASM